MKNVFLSLTLLVLVYPAFAQNRGFKLVNQPIENPTNQNRKAVVIGMSDYGGDKSLDNTLNDADDMSAVLTRLGFEVTLLKNNDLRNMNTNLTNWYNTLRGTDMAIFYFAGHGLEVGGQNYLVPVDAQMNSETDVQYATVNVNQVLGNMEEKGVVMKLLILDACRNNPFTRSWRGNNSQGLAQMNAPEGTFIAFAASPGALAHDGGTYNLRNGVFTHYILQEIIKAGATIDEIFSKVAGGVSARTNRQQIPFRNTSLTDVFYFIPSGANNPTTSLTENPLVENPPPPRTENPSVNNPTPSSVVNAVAALVSQADAHYDNKRYSEAVTLYKHAAEQGSAWSQFRLGRCYAYGDGVTKDYNQAEQWYRKAAEQGHNQAIQGYTKAAEQGDAMAQNYLGYCYQMGYGVTQDKDQAVYWYKKAADQGNDNAKNNLKNMGVRYP